MNTPNPGTGMHGKKSVMPMASNAQFPYLLTFANRTPSYNTLRFLKS